MESVKYIGLDVHQSTISVAVLNAEGKVMMQSVIATKATAVLDLLKGLRGVRISPSKKERTRPGSTMWWCGRWRGWWCVIRARMRC